jgi:hypothetical protein
LLSRRYFDLKYYKFNHAVPDRFDKSPKDMSRLARYGINRAEKWFWACNWFQKRFLEDESAWGRLFELNRCCDNT